MELALQELSIATATKPITADYDPYKIYQVHDYKDISFLRQSAPVKSASSETIRVFAQNYPELLKEKFLYVLHSHMHQPALAATLSPSPSSPPAAPSMAC